ncbi:MAG: hypothetical protein QM605_06325 [Sphingobium sp.]
MRMMRYGLAMAVPGLAAMGLAVAGWATPPKPPSCRQLSEGLLKNAMTPKSRVRDSDGTCQFTDVRIKTGTLQAWSVDQLTVTGLRQWDGKTSPLPPSLKVEAKGIRFAPEIENARTRYLMALTQKPFDARLDFGYDVAAQQLSIREVALESPWLGHIGFAVEAAFHGDNFPKAEDMKGLRISSARFVLDNKIVLESMIMPTLIAMIPDDKDPAVEFPRLQKDAERRWRKLPEEVLDRQSRDALIAFTRDFPHPSGHFEFDIRFAEPLSLDDATQRKKEKDWLKAAHIAARYEPRPDEPS